DHDLTGLHDTKPLHKDTFFGGHTRSLVDIRDENELIPRTMDTADEPADPVAPHAGKLDEPDSPVPWREKGDNDTCEEPFVVIPLDKDIQPAFAHSIHKQFWMKSFSKPISSSTKSLISFSAEGHLSREKPSLSLVMRIMSLRSTCFTISGLWVV